VFVEFGDVNGSQNAAAVLRNRQFCGRMVLCTFYPEDQYQFDNLSLA
jgi:hypothetical protein